MSQEKQEERHQLQVALGITLLIGGVLWVAVKTALNNWLGNVQEPFLSAVLSRSLNDLYRLGLLSAVLMIIPHGLWVLFRMRTVGDDVAKTAYDRAGLLLQTLFTSFGFLGTIVGVSIAVAGLDEAMKSREPDMLIVGLGTAFDTTFLGLLGAILVMITRRLISLAGERWSGK